MQTRPSALQPGPDLVVTEISAPKSLRIDEPFTATVKVCNQGADPATTYFEPPRLELYLSTDAYLSIPGGAPLPPDQRMIGGVDVPPLASGQCVARRIQAQANLPAEAQGAGAYYLGAIVDTLLVLDEADETNNAFVSGLMGVGNGPDLVVTKVTGPASVRNGEAFTAAVTVCNEGTEAVYNTSSVELYLSTDATLTLPPTDPGTPPPTDQRMIGVVQTVPLLAGQCVTHRANVSAHLPPDAQGDGAYYLGAIVAPLGPEPELREDNNITVSGLMGVGDRPDLVVTEVRGPASAQHGAPFTATVTVCNQGMGYTAHPPLVELYLSKDTTLSLPPTTPGAPPPTDQRAIGMVQLSALSPGQCQTRGVEVSAWLPLESQVDGAAYLGAIVDPFQVEQELREDNNATVSGLMGVGYSADLVVTEVKGPASVRPGESFTAAVTVCNQGTRASDSWNSLGLYLSMGTTLTPPYLSIPGVPMPSDQQGIGSVQLPSLQAGQCVTLKQNAYAYPPPDMQGDGALYLGAIVDPYLTEPELREDNNITVGSLMGVGFRSDLVVTEVKGPASVRPGDFFAVTTTVCNQGTTPTVGDVSLELYLSTDATFTGPQQPSIGWGLLPSLGAGQCMPLKLHVYATPPPAWQGHGVLYLGAIVDPSQSEQELREDNNTRVFGPMGAGNAADLVVTEVKGPASARPGDPVTATVTVCNQGTAPTSSASSVELYLSMDTTLMLSGPGSPMPTDQQSIGMVPVPSLGVGQCVTRSANVNVSPPPAWQGDGALYLGAIADASRSEQELREDNNATVGGLMGVGNAADLVVTKVNGPASVRPGDAFTASVTVCNQGTAPTTSASSVELYLSMDTSLTLSGPGVPSSSDQQPIGMVGLPPLSAGQCVTQSANVAAYPPPESQGNGAFYLGAIVDPSQSEPELREDNNATAGSLVGVGHASDLVVTEVKGPASVRPGDAFTATVTVCNQGTVLAYAPSVELYLSMDATLALSGPGLPAPTGQQPLGMVPVPSLEVGQCVTRSANVTASPPPAWQGDGALYLGAIADPSQSEPELREDNNITVGGLMGVGFRPDLVVTSVKGPASVRPGDSFMATVTVCNQGTAPTSSAPFVDLYLSMDTALTSHNAMPPPLDQQWIGFVTVPHLDVGQCATVGEYATVFSLPPAWSGEGALYLGAVVDWNSSPTDELRKDNNATVGSLMGVGFRSDLVVTEVKGPASMRPGDMHTATVTVCNQGTEPTSNGPSVELYLSMDTTLTLPQPGGPMPMEQQSLGTLPLPFLAAGECVTSGHRFTVQPPLAWQGEGVLYLGAIVDVNQVVPELREDNNAAVGNSMGVGHAADVVVTEVKGPASVRPGDAFTATVTVCNQGTAPASDWPAVELYLSMDTTLTPPPSPGSSPPPLADQQFLGYVVAPALGQGQCVTQSKSVTAQPPPAWQGNGALYLGAIVDVNQVVPELREDNNITVGSLMGMGLGSDLVVTEVTGPASARPGDPFAATVTVCNQGTAPTSSTPSVELYLSTDTTLTPPPPNWPGAPMPPNQQPIGMVSLPPLGAGQCVTQSANVTAFPPPAAQLHGAVYLGAIVDGARSEPELREDNNITVGSQMGVGLRSDLVVTEVTGPVSMERGQPFTASVTVCNQGTEPTQSLYAVHLYLSTDTSLAMPSSFPWGDQVQVGSTYMPPLAPGQCTTFPMPASANPPPDAPLDGSVYLAAIVDAYQVEPELREDNNITVGSQMGVGLRSDLVVKQLSAPTSVRLGHPFTAVVEVCNQGTAPVGSPQGLPTLELYISTDTTLTFPGSGGFMADQFQVGTAQVSPLAPGQCETLNVQGVGMRPHLSNSPGTHFVGVIVDAYKTEPELREDNNTRADFAIALTP
ncbi:hypothetical protein HPC49_04345 [Pyxidicoccus fallax]|uniref:CARDB domain-containing protein n=1 Tax=Pyxidicoccus fallax TaxID=394095 RepID=A0A848L9A1_9BACT|nr:CARDB domain-containing protein [Pyxidicoccus fallax]NMO15136.1 hypothetical protein [Pyxidicoccus fallax]NPC77482.1 hypothetical protein [Pyxidicoccus fallax]